MGATDMGLKAIAETIVTWSIAANAMQTLGLELTILGLIVCMFAIVVQR